MRTIGNTQYICNRKYFSNLTVDSAYWAGFIAADGCVSNRDKTLRIQISTKDKLVLKKFKSAINWTGPIQSFAQKTTGRTIYSCGIFISNRLNTQLIDDLKKLYNITPAKSLTLKPPNIIKKKLIYSFIIGYLDGDGWCCWRNHKYKNKVTKYLNIGFSGTYKVLSWIQKQLQILVPTLKSNKIQNRGNWHSLQYEGKTAINIRKLLLKYKPSFILPRKLLNKSVYTT